MPVGRSFWAVERRMALLFGICLAASLPLSAQSDSQSAKPYATLDRQSVTYRGPVPATESAQPDGAVVIGLILPLRGPQEPEGKALLAAARIALEEEQARGAFPKGRRLALAVRDESGQWGRASSEILKLIEEDHALVVITSSNGATAHQAEQIANKISFPILTLASDPTTTETNISWLFRLGPSDTDQARAMAREISEQPGQGRTLLVVQMDHDGRAGGEEFEKAAREMKMAAPERLELSSSAPQLESIEAAIHATAPDAIVVWADASAAKQLLPSIQQAAPSARVYLCSKAAQLSSASAAANLSTGSSRGSGELLTVATSAGATEVAKERFAKEYQARVGSTPGIAAFQAYEAVQLVVAGIRAKGVNRILLREYFANTEKVHSATGDIAFDPAGNSMQEFSIVRVTNAAATVAGK